MTGGPGAGAKQHPLNPDDRFFVQRYVGVERHRLSALLLYRHIEMVLQVFPPPPSDPQLPYVELGEILGRSQTRKLQQLRRINSAGADNYLTAGVAFFKPTITLILDPNRAGAFEQQSGSEKAFRSRVRLSLDKTGQMYALPVSQRLP